LFRVAYTIQGAAEAVSLPEHVVKIAIAERQLKARTIGSTTLVLHADLQRWVESFAAI